MNQILNDLGVTKSDIYSIKNSVSGDVGNNSSYGCKIEAIKETRPVLEACKKDMNNPYLEQEKEQTSSITKSRELER